MKTFRLWAREWEFVCVECWGRYKTFPSTKKLTLKPTSQGNVDLHFWLGLLWDPSGCSSGRCPLSPLLSFIAISDSLETPLPSILFPLHGLFSYSPLKHREKVPCIHFPSSSGELNFFWTHFIHERNHRIRKLQFHEVSWGYQRILLTFLVLTQDFTLFSNYFFTVIFLICNE